MAKEKNAMEEMPTGLMMRIAQKPKAMESFFAMSRPEQNQLTDYIQSASTGEDAKSRVESVVDALELGQNPYGIK